MALLTLADLQVFEPGIDPAKAEAMIASASAMAVRAAPCLRDEAALDPVDAEAVRTILRGAVLRWNAQGTTQVTQRQQTAGPFMLGETISTGERAGAGLLWPSEITELGAICKGTAAGAPRAFQVDTTPPVPADERRTVFDVGWRSW